MQESHFKELLSSYGLSDTNLPVNKERLLYKLCEGYSGTLTEAKEIIKVLSSDPDKETDKKPHMAKTGRESTINETTGQGLGEPLENLIFYVDSCAWWLKGWNYEKYLKAKKRQAISDKKLYIDQQHLTEKGTILTRRKRVTRRLKPKL